MKYIQNNIILLPTFWLWSRHYQSCFNDLGLSQPVIEPACEANNLQLRNRGDRFESFCQAFNKE